MSPSKRTGLGMLSRATVLVLAIVIAAPVLMAQALAPKRPPKQYTIEQFMDTLRVGEASFSSDQKQVLFHSNKSGVFNVYTVAAGGGEPRQLTHSTKESTYAVAYFPKDDRFLYTYDQGGNENNHLYVLENGKERDLTPGEKVKARFLEWSRDDKGFYYTTNERDPKFFDAYRMEIADFSRRLLFQNDGGFEVGEISSDQKWIALRKPNTTIDSDIFLYNVAGKELKNITAHQGDVANEVAEFDPQSKSLYFLTDEGGEFQYVARYDLATGTKTPVEKAGWDVMYTYFSRNGKYRVTGINEDARTKVIVYDTATGKPVPLPQFPQGEIRNIQFSRGEDQMAFYFNGDRSPSDLHVYDFKTKKVTRLTRSLNPAIAPEDLVEGEVVRFKSFDGTMIPAILFRPHQAGPNAWVPAIVQVHGGPGGQARKGYSALYQYLVNHSYAVLMVNNRGSSGYGKTFFAADDHKHGREPLWDCVEAKKYLQSLGWVNKDRIGILGGSYGGYMVLAALAFQPQEFAVGVDIFGVSNWLRTLKSIPPYWESFRKALYKEVGDPEKDEAFLRETSPLFHADKIRKPLIVLQGANDPRVIKPESDDIVAAVKKNGVPVEYVVFDDEGHGFSKKANETRGYKAILDFLDQYLKVATQAPKAGQ